MASDFFIKIDGIKGSCKDANHKDWIPVRTFRHGTKQTIAKDSSTEVVGRGEFQLFEFSHLVDISAPKIQEATMKGTIFKSVQLHVCRAIAGKQEIVYDVKMTNVKIQSANMEIIEIEEGIKCPVEFVKMTSDSATWKVVPINPDNTKGGAVETSCNQLTK